MFSLITSIKSCIYRKLVCTTHFAKYKKKNKKDIQFYGWNNLLYTVTSLIWSIANSERGEHSRYMNLFIRGLNSIWSLQSACWACASLNRVIWKQYFLPKSAPFVLTNHENFLTFTESVIIYFLRIYIQLING